MNQSYEKVETDFFKSSVRKGSAMIDVGAFFGYYTLLASDLLGVEGRVFAFEPEPKNYKELTRRVKQSKAKNIITQNVALSSEVGMTKLFLSEGRTMHKLYETRLSRNFIETPTTTIDKYFENSELKGNVSFIKLDTEGTEISILEEAVQTMGLNSQLSMLVEYNPAFIHLFGRKPMEIFDFLYDQGFEVDFVNYSSQKSESVNDYPQFSKVIAQDKLGMGKAYTNLLCRKNIENS